MIDTTGSKRGTRKKSRASAKGASVGRVHRKVLFNDGHSTRIPSGLPVLLAANQESSTKNT
jgi:hypothetical protein